MTEEKATAARDQALEALRREAARECRLQGEAGAPVVTLTGATPKAVLALHGQSLTIRFFPFRIGRAGLYTGAPPEEPELLLEDPPPHHLSRYHAALERHGDGLRIVDLDSRTGSRVDGRPLGMAAAGAADIPLAPGRHEIRLGGASSPFVFTAEVRRDEDAQAVEETLDLGGRVVPVFVLHNHLFHLTRDILERFFQDAPESLRLADEMVGMLLARPDVLDPLYAYSSLPEVSCDVMASHSLNVVIYTLKLSRFLGVPEGDLRGLAVAALYHDIGMYEVPREILEKRDPVTPAEFEIIKAHSAQGEAKLAVLAAAEPLIPTVAREHHERIDGGGYPRGTKTLAPRVELVALVDFFEALTHYRPQRGPVTPHEGVMALVHRNRTAFSPEGLKAFVRCFSLYPVHCVVRLNSGEIGQVADTAPDWPLRPVVRLLFDRYGKPMENRPLADLQARSELYIVRDISDRIFVDHYCRL